MGDIEYENLRSSTNTVVKNCRPWRQWQYFVRNEAISGEARLRPNEAEKRLVPPHNTNRSTKQLAAVELSALNTELYNIK